MRSLTKTQVLKATKRNITYSGKVLREGGLVAFPTETVYGLAANIFDKTAIERLYKAKERPKDKPFTVLIRDLDSINQLGVSLTKEAWALISRFWPGPLTIVLKAKSGKKIGFRMPSGSIALDVLCAANVALACPSANVSGHKPPKDAKAVLRDLDGKIDLVLDGGRTEIGIESTVVDTTLSRPKILREGAISAGDIFSTLKK